MALSPPLSLPLASLFCKPFGRQRGVRAARIYGALLGAGNAAAIWIVGRPNGVDATVVSLVARASAMLTCVAGGIAALALSVPPKDQALVSGIVALASSHGIDERSIARAEALATVRLLAEVVVYPMLAVTAFVLALIAGSRETLWPILGAAVFAVVGAGALGALAVACRRFGQSRGRSWLAAIVFLPWIVAEVAMPRHGSEFLSIPGLLGRAWQALTQGGA